MRVVVIPADPGYPIPSTGQNHEGDMILHFDIFCTCLHSGMGEFSTHFSCRDLKPLDVHPTAMPSLDPKLDSYNPVQSLPLNTL